MSKKELFLSLSMLLNVSGEYTKMPIYDDQEVIDCLMEMYFFMLAEKKEDKDKHFTKFDILYNNLNEEQQELVKQDYLSIIEAQDANEKEETYTYKYTNPY